jgi:hypothetical protein
MLHLIGLLHHWRILPWRTSRALLLNYLPDLHIGHMVLPLTLLFLAHTCKIFYNIYRGSFYASRRTRSISIDRSMLRDSIIVANSMLLMVDWTLSTSRSTLSARRSKCRVTRWTQMAEYGAQFDQWERIWTYWFLNGDPSVGPTHDPPPPD